MKCHEDLDVWQKAVALSVAIYELTKGFPSDEKFGLTSQMRRASVSIASNIAEGAARQSPREFVQFLSIASGSAAELATQLVIAGELSYSCPDVTGKFSGDIKEVSRMLQGLISFIRKRLRASD